MDNGIWADGGLRVSVLSLNCWGIAQISKDRLPRMAAISEQLKSGTYDFVFLQEVWVEEDFKLIAKVVAKVLPYSHYFHSGVIGGGICIFSSAPIVDVFFQAWSLNGHMHKIQHGDWFGGKGVGLCTVLYQGLKINLYVTHLHAEYSENDEYKAHRMVQAFETSQFIRHTRKNADLCILGGDLNTEFGDLPYRLIRFNTSLQDAFINTGKDEVEGVTSETPANSYTAPESLKKCPNGKRIDYVMFSSKSELKVETITCVNPFPSRVEGCPYSYSDHEPVCAKLIIMDSMTKGPSVVAEIKKDVCKSSLEEAVNVCDSALEKLATDKLSYFVIFGTILILISALPHSSLSILHYLLVAIRIFLILAAAFCLIMATAWNRIERHGILAGKLGMQIRLNSLQAKNLFSSTETKI